MLYLMSSLFPSAYDEGDVEETKADTAVDRSWLQNPSYVPPQYEDSTESSSSSLSSPEGKKKKKGIKKKPKHETSRDEPKTSSEAFRIERLSDPDNLRYDSVYSGDVSTYRRKFDCLGLKPNQALKWTDGRSRTRKRKKKSNFSTEERYFTTRLKFEASDVIIPKTVQFSEVDCLKDYIQLEMGTAKKLENEDSLTAERHMTILTGEFNASLLDQPHNVSLWLEFLSFQDHLLEWGHLPGESSDHASRKRQAVVERKLSIYERALELNPMAEELLLGYMDLVREKWETERVIKKWKDIVFHQPNNPALWLGYIHFCQTNFSSFRTSSVTSVYCKCIGTLASILEGSLKSHQPIPHTPSYMLTIFSLYCGYLKQSGLVERAVACYQALVDFNLCTPLELTEGVPLNPMKEFFEAYWDSGMPRFGERGAMGWSNWSEASKTSTARQLLGVLQEKNILLGTEGEARIPLIEDRGEDVKEKQEEEEEEVELNLVAGLSVPQAWSVLEDHRSTQNHFPWQPDVGKGETLDDCADPDRIVIFDDVSPTLFKLPDPDLKLNLVLSFLSFLGAPRSEPFLFPTTKSNSSLRYETLNEALPGAAMLLSSGEEASDNQHYQPSGIGVSTALPQFSSLVDLAECLSSQALEDLCMDSSLSSSISNNFISNVCNQAMTVLPAIDQQTQLAQLWFTHLHTRILKKCQSGLEMKSLKSEICQVEKIFKELLRLEQHRNNLLLWNSYALFHYSLGNFKEAKKLYQSLLAQVNVVSSCMCSSLCECFMGLRWSRKERSGDGVDRNFALHALICFIEGKSSTYTGIVTPSQVLKARTLFSSSQSEHASVESSSGILCRCYFEYLTKGLKEACRVVDDWRDCHYKLSSVAERKMSRSFKVVFLKQLRLMEHHSLTNPLVLPSLMRELLQRALGVFPEEAEIMAAFVRHERQSFISGRVRRHFDKVVEDTESVLPWLFAIMSELDRYAKVTGRRLESGGSGTVEELSVGTVCRIMNLLSRATSSMAGRHCPLLWRLCMVIQNFKDPSKVLSVFYQAIHHCPWSKVLYLDVVKLVPTELDKVMELLEEKELRICIPVEEVKLML